MSIVAVGVEWRIDVNQVDTTVREFAKLVKAIAAINNARINER